MKALKPCLCLLLVVAFVALTGCAEENPFTAEHDAQMSAETSGCYAVKFYGDYTGPSTTTSTMTITGDLEGTLYRILDQSSIRVTGNTVHNTWTGYWNITGGVVPRLGEFTTTISQTNNLNDRPGSPANLYENKGTHRLLSGDNVTKANLKFQGTFLATGGGAGTLDWEFQGVICME